MPLMPVDVAVRTLQRFYTSGKRVEDYTRAQIAPFLAAQKVRAAAKAAGTWEAAEARVMAEDDRGGVTK